MENQRKEHTVDELTAEIEDLRAENERLQQQVDMLKKAVFGPKSEKKVFHDADSGEQLSLFNEAETEARREESEEVTVLGHKRKKKRSRAEILGALPTEEVIHKVEDKTCDKCGSEMKIIGKEFVHDELVYIPAKMFIRKHYVEVVKCASCGKDESRDAELDDIEKEHFRKAKAPEMLIPRSFCSPELLAHIEYSKYNNAMPLYRIEQDMKDHGVIEISNNRAENAIRPFVVGRKNWLFSDSPKGASASAMLYSLVISAKMNDLNAEDYLIRLFSSTDSVLPYETT